MANKKLSTGEILFWLIVVLWLCSICSCASQSPKVENSNHYRAQAQPQGYQCPYCKHEIDAKNVDDNIRIKNICPYCGKNFFYTPQAETRESQSKPYQGPNVLVRGYHQNIEYKTETEYSDENNWEVSPSGDKGSISSTTIIKHEHTAKGEHGRTIGAGGLGRYGGYGH